VAAGLLAAAGTGDGGGDAGLREDPAQARLRERHLPGERLLEPCHGREPRPVLHAGEGLALVERLAVTVEAAMVVLGEAAGRGELSGQQTGGERHAGDDRSEERRV